MPRVSIDRYIFVAIRSVAMEELRKELRNLRSRRGMQHLRRHEETQLSHVTLQAALRISLMLDCGFSAGAVWLQLEKSGAPPWKTAWTPRRFQRCLKLCSWKPMLICWLRELTHWTRR